LQEAEAGEGNEPRHDVDKVTISATYHRMHGDTIWASTVAWGRNSESGRATNGVLFETSVALADRDTWFGRLEVVGKTEHDLDVEPIPGIFALTKLQGGYTRYFPVNHGFRAGLGALLSVSIVPSQLHFTYGSRPNVGVGVFLALRPAMMTQPHPGATSSGGMVMVQTAFDPAKLSCVPPIDPKTAPSTTFRGKTYYFCSDADRRNFLKDPAMSLSMMPPKQ
jgi:YHS domain-containing protein